MGIARLRAALVASAILTLFTGLAPNASAQVQPPPPEPPVSMVIGIANLGDLTAVAVLVQNRTNTLIVLADVRCVIDPNWTYVQSWAGDKPGQNLGFPSLTALWGPDGETKERTVISWIHKDIPGLTAGGPFIYMFTTNGKPGFTWCNGTFIGGNFNRNITSDTFEYSP